MFLKQNSSHVLKFTTHEEKTVEYLLCHKFPRKVNIWFRDSARPGRICITIFSHTIIKNAAKVAVNSDITLSG
jgi:hypothetical protein